MAQLLQDSSDSEVDFKVNEDYATNYNKWRGKEELQKLKDRYGENAELSSSSSSEFEDEEELSNIIDEQFLKTLSLLKSKAPEIYDANVTFFPSTSDSNLREKPKKKKKKKDPMFLKDYERKIILEKDGVLTDEDDTDDNNRPYSPTYMQEQEEIKKSFKQVLDDSDNEDDILKQKEKAIEEQSTEEEEYIQFIKGEAKNLDTKSSKTELKYLKEYWNNPRLEEGEAFLRDYILNKSFLENETTSGNTNNDDALSVSEDEKIFEQQEEFEHKFNFRFEEPDEDFIKRFPRTINNTLRRKDPKRKKQREDYRERKREEKEKKKEELKRLKALKRKEIADKLEQLKDITGNQKLGFDDLEEDFDPEKYDSRMKEIFDEQYYGEDETEAKPVFPFDKDIDAEDNWDNWRGSYNDNNGDDNKELHCEDPNFNMDVEYDAKSDLKNEMLNASRKSKKKLSKFAEVVSKKKPTFDPTKKSYEDYLDEYYKLDFEDIVGDMPVRFPYRTTVPNDFGLSVEEILAAHDKELNQWCSLKKTCQYRTEQEEKYDVQAFRKKAENVNIKQKCLPSLFKSNEDETQEMLPKRKRKRKNKKTQAEENQNTTVAPDNSEASTTQLNVSKELSNVNNGGRQGGFKNLKINTSKKPKRKNTEMGKSGEIINGVQITDERLKAYGLNPKKFKNKIKHRKQ